MVNGRITERNFARSRRVGAGLLRWMLSNMDQMLVQSEADAERIRLLAGDRDAPERIQVFGNSKFDQEISLLSDRQKQELRRALHFPDDAPISSRAAHAVLRRKNRFFAPISGCVSMCPPSVSLSRLDRSIGRKRWQRRCGRRGFNPFEKPHRTQRRVFTTSFWIPWGSLLTFMPLPILPL